MSSPSLDFGYPWWLSHGHLVLAAVLAAALFLGFQRKWPKAALLVMGLAVVWSTASFAVMRFVIDLNGQPSLPTARFFEAGEGKVLDMGAGTGRSSIMVLAARPKATLVALDLFAESFEHHFGASGSPQQRLLDNLKAAHVDGRTTIQQGDMRRLPFEAGAFDAVVSSYAIDHLNPEGSRQALAEAARVLKPGGDFLLMVVGKEPWVQFAFGPLLSHGGFRGAGWWDSSVREAGFQVLERGTRPLTFDVLARRT